MRRLCEGKENVDHVELSIDVDVSDSVMRTCNPQLIGFCCTVAAEVAGELELNFE